ncbi:MAG: hypothetical protein GY861_09930 [bacterium]|nr:hypothetical protein [bacterium]
MKKKGMTISVLGWMILALILIIVIIIIVAISRDASYNIWEHIMDIFRFGGS